MNTTTVMMTPRRQDAKPGVYSFLLLLAALLLFIWSTAANEFEFYLWDTFNQMSFSCA